MCITITDPNKLYLGTTNPNDPDAKDIIIPSSTTDCESMYPSDQQHSPSVQFPCAVQPASLWTYGVTGWDYISGESTFWHLNFTLVEKVIISNLSVATLTFYGEGRFEASVHGRVDSCGGKQVEAWILKNTTTIQQKLISCENCPSELKVI
jgi:hypothetical protein